MAVATPQRRASPRIAIELSMRFVRAKGHGRPVSARTIDLSTGGARVVADRPLKVDEVLHFELDGEQVVRGECRVLREHVGRTYAVRFERLQETEELARLTGSR
ncbi:MAG TPA: PilZ domain-containing protein [Solirubrobacteraceae bacterium]|jgi:c-di-GMP-binding flagellar brake protein YcgR